MAGPVVSLTSLVCVCVCAVCPHDNFFFPVCMAHRYFPPHVMRKRKIEELETTCAFKERISVADFYTRLFTGHS